MIIDQAVIEKESEASEQLSFQNEPISIELEKAEAPLPSWFARQVFTYLLPGLKD